MLRVTNMSSAILSVYLDSASDLPQVRAQSKPDPFVVLSVGKHNEQTAALKRTDAPVYEQGFTFLVGNPENDTLFIRIVDQKTEKELGVFTYILSALLTKKNLELVAQPFQLQKSGPTSKINMSLALKILRPTTAKTSESVTLGHDHEVPSVQRQQSQQQADVVVPDLKSVKLAELPSDASVDVVADEVFAQAATRPLLASMPSVTSESIDDGQSTLRRRELSSQSSIGSYGLGRIQITLRYSIQRQRLTVIIHKVV